MLKNDLIERSHSARSAPCILVPKPDKTYKFSTDFVKSIHLPKRPYALFFTLRTVLIGFDNQSDKK